MKKQLIIILAFMGLHSCSGDRNLYFKKEPSIQSVKMARRLSVDFPAIDPESGFLMVSAKSFKLYPVEVIDQMYGYFGNNVLSFEKQTKKDIVRTINETAEGLGIRTLKINLALEAGIRVSEAELDSTLQARYDEAGGEEKFMEHLKAEEIAMEDVLLNTRRYLLVDKFEKHLYADLPPVTESDIIRTYQEPKTATVRSIFFSTKGKNENEIAAVRKKATEVLAKAKKGENFLELARAYNEDPATQRNAGFYPNFHRGEMRAQLEEAAFSLPIDSTSDIIETEDGLHIFKILDRVKEPRPLGEVREDIKRTIIKLRKRKIMEDFMEKAKQEQNYQFRRLS